MAVTPGRNHCPSGLMRPRHAPDSSPRCSMYCLKRFMAPLMRRSSVPSTSAARPRTVSTASGWTRRSDAVVLATGVRPRPFLGAEGLHGVHVVRTLEDAVALRDAVAHHHCARRGRVARPGARRVRRPAGPRYGGRPADGAAGKGPWRSVGDRRGAARGRGGGRDRLRAGDRLAARQQSGAGQRCGVRLPLPGLRRGHLRGRRRRPLAPRGARRPAAAGEPDERHRAGRRRRRQHPRRGPPLHPRPVLLDRPVRRQDPGVRHAFRRRRCRDRGRLRERPPVRRPFTGRAAGPPASSVGTCPSRPACTARSSSMRPSNPLRSSAEPPSPEQT